MGESSRPRGVALRALVRKGLPCARGWAWSPATTITSAGLDLVKVGLIFYMMRIDIWPDDRAVSLWLGRARVQTLFQTSTTSAAGRACAPSAYVHRQRKGLPDDYGHREILQRPKRLRLHPAGRRLQGRVRPRHRAGARGPARPRRGPEGLLRHRRGPPLRQDRRQHHPDRVRSDGLRGTTGLRRFAFEAAPPWGGFLLSSTRERFTMAKEELMQFDGLVTEILPDARFRVQLDAGHKVVAYTAGKMKRNRIKTLAGDRVAIEMSPYDLEKGRLVFRHKDERAGPARQAPPRAQFRRR